jgi:hypothetical protein
VATPGAPTGRSRLQGGLRAARARNQVPKVFASFFKKNCFLLFFFEKKNQKTFVYFGLISIGRFVQACRRHLGCELGSDRVPVDSLENP